MLDNKFNSSLLGKKSPEVNNIKRTIISETNLLLKPFDKLLSYEDISESHLYGTL